MKQEKAFDASDIVHFLKHLLWHISGELLSCGMGCQYVLAGR
jgi:hypothetical protein